LKRPMPSDALCADLFLIHHLPLVRAKARPILDRQN